jgi:tetratricopeptide (TPR) repeat protein
MAQRNYRDKARNELLEKENIGEAIKLYTLAVERNQKKHRYEPDLLGEYAYALALGGVYDNALMQLDRARLYYTNKINTNDMNNYIAWVFELMGYEDLAEGFNRMITNGKPYWIKDEQRSHLKQKFQQISHINHDDIETAFKRANFLAANGMLLQSAALFRELLKEYPEGFVLYAGYSIVLEKLGFMSLAKDAMSTSLKYIPSDSDFVETRTAFHGRFNNLQRSKDKKRPTSGQNGWMLYLGGFATLESGGLSSRFGIYTVKNLNFSADFGLSFSAEDILANLGTSIYKNVIGRRTDLMFGISLGTQLGTSYSLYTAQSIGIRFKPFYTDIYFNLNHSTSFNNYYLGCSITIGQSIYFGKRRKK